MACLHLTQESGQVKQISGPRPGYTRVANSKQQHVDSATRADSQRDPSDRGLRKKRAARAVSGEESVWELNCLSGDQLPSLHDHFDPVTRIGHLHNLRPRSRDRGDTFSARREDGTSWGQDARPAALGFGRGSSPTSSNYRGGPRGTPGTNQHGGRGRGRGSPRDRHDTT